MMPRVRVVAGREVHDSNPHQDQDHEGQQPRPQITLLRNFKRRTKGWSCCSLVLERCRGRIRNRRLLSSLALLDNIGPHGPPLNNASPHALSPAPIRSNELGVFSTRAVI